MPAARLDPSYVTAMRDHSCSGSSRVARTRDRIARPEMDERRRTAGRDRASARSRGCRRRTTRVTDEATTARSCVSVGRSRSAMENGSVRVNVPHTGSDDRVVAAEPNAPPPSTHRPGPASSTRRPSTLRLLPGPGRPAASRRRRGTSDVVSTAASSKARCAIGAGTCTRADFGRRQTPRRAELLDAASGASDARDLAPAAGDAARPARGVQSSSDGVGVALVKCE